MQKSTRFRQLAPHSGANSAHAQGSGVLLPLTAAGLPFPPLLAPKVSAQCTILMVRLVGGIAADAAGAKCGEGTITGNVRVEESAATTASR